MNTGKWGKQWDQLEAHLLANQNVALRNGLDKAKVRSIGGWAL